MKYENTVAGRFISRPNRFIAEVEIDGRRETAHVKNTGRCRELLRPGAAVILQRFPESSPRKTKLDLIAVYKGKRLINMDSQSPNKAAAEFIPKLFENVTLIRPETKFGNSRFDFYIEAMGGSPGKITYNIPCDNSGNDGKSPENFPGDGKGKFSENCQGKIPCDNSGSSEKSPENFPKIPGDDKKLRKIFMEVKGVTLEDKGVCKFPDAPTERGRKHLDELAECVKSGYEAYILFVIQMAGVKYFTPNRDTDPKFGEALERAVRAGVTPLACDCRVTESGMTIRKPVKIIL